MKLGAYSLLFVVLIILSSCSLQNSPSTDVTTKNVESPTSMNSDLEEDWSYYSNDRFGYTIKYPSSWIAGEESENGDGKILHTGNPDVDIRVYASYYKEGLSDIYHDEDAISQYIKLGNGNESVLLIGKKDGKVKYDMVYVSNEEIEYHFYAEVTEAFFEKNEKILLEVASSLETQE